MSRSVRDTAAALDATAGSEIGEPYAAPPQPSSYLAAIKRKPGKLRIAFTTKRLDGEACDPECKAAAEGAATLCEKLGHHVEDGAPQVSIDDIGDPGPIFASNLTMTVDLIAKATSKTPAREEFEGSRGAFINSAKLSAPRNTTLAARICGASHAKSPRGSNLTTPGLRRSSQHRR